MYRTKGVIYSFIFGMFTFASLIEYVKAFNYLDGTSLLSAITFGLIAGGSLYTASYCFRPDQFKLI